MPQTGRRRSYSTAMAPRPHRRALRSQRSMRGRRAMTRDVPAARGAQSAAAQALGRAYFGSGPCRRATAAFFRRRRWPSPTRGRRSPCRPGRPGAGSAGVEPDPARRQGRFAPNGASLAGCPASPRPSAFCIHTPYPPTARTSARTRAAARCPLEPQRGVYPDAEPTFSESPITATICRNPALFRIFQQLGRPATCRRPGPVRHRGHRCCSPHV